MKKQILALSAAASIALLTGCAGNVGTPMMGGLYTDATGPLVATGNAAGTKEGKAECKSILGAVATGDCSIEAAAKAGGITQISHVDTQFNNILGIIATRTTIVRGK